MAAHCVSMTFTAGSTGGKYKQNVYESNLPGSITYRTQMPSRKTVSYSAWQSGTLNAGTFVNSSLYDMGQVYGQAFDITQPYETVYRWRRVS